MPVKKTTDKKQKVIRNDLNHMEMKEIHERKELGKKSKLPRGIFVNTGGSDKNLKSTRELQSDMNRRLEHYESQKRKSKPKSKKKNVK